MVRPLNFVFIRQILSSTIPDTLSPLEVELLKIVYGPKLRELNRWEMEMWGDGEAGEEEAGGQGAGCRVQGAGCRGRILTFAFCFLLSVPSH